MDTLQNYYQLLHVLPDAPSPVIKASFRVMMQKMRNHPDLGGDPSRAQLLNKAVDILCNPASRAIYDKELQANSRMKRNAATPDSGNGKSSPQARNYGSHTGEACDMPGGRPYGYERRTTKPDKSVDPEPVRKTERPVPEIQLPTRPHCLFCKTSFSTPPRIRHYSQSDNQCRQCKAPTAAIEQLSSSTTEELRRIYRHDHHAVVRLWTHWPLSTHVEARLQDLSLAGCAIESDTELDDDAVVLLDTEALKAICQVKYCKPLAGGSIFSIGLAFKTMETKARPGSMFSAVA